MGNRSIVIFHEPKSNDISPAVYLHWNGGPESIYAFLDEMDRRKVRTNDTMYESARFTHIVADFFDHEEAGGSSLGLFNSPATIDRDTMCGLDDQYGLDNGVFVVTRGKKRLVRRFVGGKEQSASWVGKERTAAYKDAYMDQKEGIPATFRRVRPFIEGDNHFRTRMEEAFGKAVAAWNDGTVVEMAKSIYDGCEFEQLPLLADALQDAGYDGVWLLGKLRGPNPCETREDFVRLLTWADPENQKK